MREKNQETQVDIIAEMRMGNPVGPCAYRIGLPDKEEVYESGAKRRITMIKAVTVQELADRLEAAAKREKEQHGNAAAIREALAEAWKVIKAMGGYWAMVTLPIIDAALSAPPRNCDVGTAEEQSERFMNFCRPGNRPPNCEKCKVYPKRMNRFWCQLAWAQTPYAEEGAGE